jgi:putative heme iron utilization protein
MSPPGRAGSVAPAPNEVRPLLNPPAARPAASSDPPPLDRHRRRAKLAGMPDELRGDERAERIRAALARDRRTMTVQVARELGVPEVEVIRCLPDGRAVELDASRWEELVRRFESLGQVHVIVTNAAATLEAFGTFGNFSTFGEYFNVQTKALDMHVRHAQLAAAFAVEKPGHLDGVNTLSFQFYDRAGAAAFKVFLTFGGAAPPAEKVEQFARIRDEFRLRA